MSTWVVSKVPSNRYLIRIDPIKVTKRVKVPTGTFERALFVLVM